MLIAFAVAVVHTLRRHTMTALLLLAPAIGYYVIVIARIQFVYSRFLFPVIVFLSILTGIATADLLRSKRLPRGIRFGIPALVMLFTLGYSAAITLEMRADSRYDVERWLSDNAPPSASIGAFGAFEEMQLRPQYLPRFHDLGYATYPVSMTFDSFDRAQPDYLVLSSFNYEDFNQEQESCRQSLVRGELGYHVVKSFASRYLDTGKSWLSVAGWGAPIPGKISTTLIVLKRDDKE